jgi:RNA polymerase sigma-70 factor (ECF subfamily)
METVTLVRPSAAGGPAGFATTHWSQVLAAGDDSSPQAAAALAQLCQTYWYPLYAFVRRQGFDTEAAQDLTQEFFARLLDKNFIANASQEKGRFRSFLLVALKRFLINEWERSRAQKRGGGQAVLSLDTELAEVRYGLEPVDEMTADRIFERRWALALLEEVLEALRCEYDAAGKVALFDALKIFLYGEKSAESQAAIAARFEMTEGAVRAAVHRLRGRYRDRLREFVGRTVANPSEIEPELRHLLAVLSA